MKSTSINSSLYYPENVWAPTSRLPQCSNPNCCSRDDRKTQLGGLQRKQPCEGETHNALCCEAPGNKTCSPEHWQVLYARYEPDFEDEVRRQWMARWLSGQCSLSAAVEGHRMETARWAACLSKEAA